MEKTTTGARSSLIISGPSAVIPEGGKNAIIEEDRKNKYVSTSPSERVATNFAYMRGHLESGRRSHVGYIITYEVDPSSIVLDATIFGSPYGEGEVLIDATKAKVKNIKKI